MNNSHVSTSRETLMKNTALALTIAIMLIGGAVIIGWILRYAPMVQIYRDFAPMQFNTALCFFLSGASLFLITLQRLPSLSKILGLCLAIISSLTFIEYIIDINFGLDNFFVDPFVTTKTTHPGRMAPHTALCFILTSLPLMLLGTKHYKISAFSVALSLLVFVALSFIAFSFYDGNLYGMGTFTRMAIHTTFCFSCIAVTLFLIIANLKDHTKINKWDLLPIVSFVLLSLLSFFAWHTTKESVYNASKQFFLAHIAESQNIIHERFSLYKQSLLGGLGLFNASDNVTLAEWKKYVDALNVDESLPSINGIGYIDHIKAQDLDKYLADVQKDSYPDYKNHPQTSFDDKFIIRYSEPISKNKPAIGLDIGFEANRRKAAEQSRDWAKPVLTRKISLVQDNVKRAGFLFLIHRYKGGAIPKTVEERRRLILGWVYAPFIADLFLEGTGDDHIGFTVYDGGETTADNIIFESVDRVDPLLEHETTFFAAEQTWTIHWFDTPSYGFRKQNLLPVFVLLTGFLITTLITAMLFLLARINGQSAQDLMDSRNQLNAVVEGAVDGLITINAQGKIMRFNKACEAIFGYQSDYVIGQDVTILMPSNSISPYRDYLENPGKLKSENILGRVQQTNAIRSNGEKFPIDLSLSQITVNDEMIYSGIVRDITDRQAAEDENRRSNEELEYFAYIASHDLQEPLRMVANFTGLLDAEYSDKLDGDSKKYMEFILDGATRMQILVADLLEYSRTNSDDAGFEAFNANVQMNIVLQNLNEQIEQTQSVVTFDAMPTDLYCNPVRFTRLVQNLVGNGIKYRHKDKKTTVHVSVTDRDDEWLFSVTDNGIGIKDEYLNQIFVIFKRLHGKSDYSGTGIGLSVCKKIVENMGGTIWAESTINEGSAFHFTIKKP